MIGRRNVVARQAKRMKRNATSVKAVRITNCFCDVASENGRYYRNIETF
jgi:hypothetical protein